MLSRRPGITAVGAAIAAWIWIGCAPLSVFVNDRPDANQEQVAGNHATAAGEQPFFVRYSSSTQTIEIVEDQIRHTLRHEAFDNPASPVPASVQLQTRRATLNAAQRQALVATIRDSGFLDLGPSYGAAEGERYYPYRLEVNLDGRANNVLFRSNPAFERAPQAFSRIEAALTELLGSIHDWRADR
ncbi:MAG: hypothetical protein K1X75_11145 [Leptospirales bacterium]|nr:hypothetical protein [Leptospirales bacterium]